MTDKPDSPKPQIVCVACGAPANIGSPPLCSDCSNRPEFADTFRATARIDKRGAVTVTEFRPVRQRQEKPDGR
jgi:hypothetical protein